MKIPASRNSVAIARATPRRAGERYLFLRGLYILLLAAMVALSGCTSESGDSETETLENRAGGDAPASGDDVPQGEDEGGATGFAIRFAVSPSAQSTLLPGLGVTDFVVVSTRRIGRTTMEYVLKLKVSNASSTRYKDAVATLESTPAHIVIIDGIAVIGDVPSNSTVLSQDSFTINVNLAIATSFDDFVWRIDGDVLPPPQPPPPGETPAQSGIFMNIDDLSIKGESTSASHPEWIVLSAVMDGLRRDGLGSSGSGRSRAQFVFDGVQVIKELDRSTPKLREAIADGRIFTEVQIDIIRSCGGNFYTAFAITLGIARLDELSLNGNAAERPVEQLAFNYTRISTMYTPVEDDCSLGAPVFSTQDGELLEL